MDIPSDLVNQVREGRVVIFLGAGASCTAVTKDGQQSPTTAELGCQLSDKFLGGYLRDGQLSQIAEYAISETDLGRVQSFIRTDGDGLMGTDGTFSDILLRWHAWHVS